MVTLLPEGKHKFSGIDTYKRPGDYWGECMGYYVVIDDTVYAFKIDPDDGYRSYGNLYIPENISVNDIKNRFPAQDVIITLHNRGEVYDKQFYTIIDVVTGKVILKIGTDYTESYYPMAICHYNPENMAINNTPEDVSKEDDNISYIMTEDLPEWVSNNTGMCVEYTVTPSNIEYNVK